jgi:hypothetical protein
VVLADEQRVVRDAEDRVVKSPPAARALLRVLAAHCAHAVQVVAVNGNDELREVLVLVDRVNVRRQSVQERARLEARHEVLGGRAAAGLAAPPLAAGELAEPGELRLIGRDLARLAVVLGLQDATIMLGRVEVRVHADGAVL